MLSRNASFAPVAGSCAVALWIAVSACTTYRRERLDLPKEDRGVAEIGALVEVLKSAARNRDFDKAYDILDELEVGIKDAHLYTSSHPDFDEIARAVGKARPALDDLVERDRRERLAAAIAVLIGRMQDTLERGNAIVARFLKPTAVERDVDALDDVVDEVLDLEDEGKEFLGESQFADYLIKTRPTVTHLQERLKQARWAQKFANAVAGPISAAISGETGVRRLSEAANTVEGWSNVIGSLETCVARVEEARSDHDYTSDLKMETGWGPMGVEEIGLTCSMRLSSAQAELERARWHVSVKTAVAHANAAQEHPKTQGTAAERLAAARSATKKLEACQTALIDTERHAGFDSEVTFATPFGQKSASLLRKECAQQMAHLESTMGSLNWLASLEAVSSRVAEAHKQAMTAGQAGRPEDNIMRLGQAVGGFLECVERSEHLTSSPHRDLAARTSIPFGRVTVKEMQRLCQKQHAKIQERLEKNRRAAKPVQRRTSHRATRTRMSRI